MATEQGRRDFIIGTACTVALAAGCETAGALADGGAPMRNFRVPPMQRIRVGVVGVGYRGFGAIGRLVNVPGVELVAICETRKEFLDRAVVAGSGRAGGNPGQIPRNCSP